MQSLPELWLYAVCRTGLPVHLKKIKYLHFLSKTYFISPGKPLHLTGISKSLSHRSILPGSEIISYSEQLKGNYWRKRRPVPDTPACPLTCSFSVLLSMIQGIRANVKVGMDPWDYKGHISKISRSFKNTN